MYKIDTQVSFDGTRLALRKLALGLDGSKVTGDADVVVALGKPQVTAKLQANLQNAGKLMQQFGQSPEQFGLDASFDPTLSSAIALSVDGSNISAKMSDLSAALDGAEISGNADVALADSKPDVTATLSVSAPDVARLAKSLGQPLSKFGLSSDAKPTLKTNVSAQLRNGVTKADLRNLVATIAGANVSGNVALDLSSSLPAVTGDITAVVPSTSNLMRALGQSATNIPKGFGQAITAKTALSLKSNQLNLSGLSVSLDQNTYSGSVF